MASRCSSATWWSKDASVPLPQAAFQARLQLGAPPGVLPALAVRNWLADFAREQLGGVTMQGLVGPHGAVARCGEIAPPRFFFAGIARPLHWRWFFQSAFEREAVGRGYHWVVGQTGGYCTALFNSCSSPFTRASSPFSCLFRLFPGRAYTTVSMAVVTGPGRLYLPWRAWLR